MAYDIGPRIKITGEKEFNDQINRINNSLKEYGFNNNIRCIEMKRFSLF